MESDITSGNGAAIRTLKGIFSCDEKDRFYLDISTKDTNGVRETASSFEKCLVRLIGFHEGEMEAVELGRIPSMSILQMHYDRFHFVLPEFREVVDGVVGMHNRYAKLQASIALLNRQARAGY